MKGLHGFDDDNRVGLFSPFVKISHFMMFAVLTCEPMFFLFLSAYFLALIVIKYNCENTGNTF